MPRRRLTHALLAPLAALALAACGGRPAAPTPPRAPTGPSSPAEDLAAARTDAPRVDPAQGGLVARDPRVVDLDIIKIRAQAPGIGGDPELTSVASADVFRAATDAAKDGRAAEAIARYRALVTEFPDSQFAPLALFNIAALRDGQGDLEGTLAALAELVGAYPQARESIDGQLYIAALQADHQRWPAALATLDAALARSSLTFADQLEAHARRGYVLVELAQLDAADAALTAAAAAWRRSPRLDDPYYIAMASYYRGEVAHRRFLAAPVRRPDDQIVTDLETKRVLAVAAYDRWREALAFKHAYWATAAGYQMSQIFVELWEAHARAPYPARIAPATRPVYVAEVHARIREHLDKALEGHRMNVELARAYGVETPWSRGSEQLAAQVMALLQREGRGELVTPAAPGPPVARPTAATLPGGSPGGSPGALPAAAAPDTAPATPPAARM